MAELVWMPSPWLRHGFGEYINPAAIVRIQIRQRHGAEYGGGYELRWCVTATTTADAEIVLFRPDKALDVDDLRECENWLSDYHWRATQGENHG